MSRDRETLRLDRPAERVARITLSNPPVNALSRRLVGELGALLEELASEDALCCVILTAEGKAFCAGADLKERKGMSDDEVAATVRGLGALATQLAELPMPTLAGIGGAALGGGLELALACDMRIAAAGAKLGLPETSLAIVPGAGGTQRLARVIGPARAKRWILTARVATAEIAYEEGLVDALVGPGELEAALLERAAEVARCGPLALRAAKRAIDRGFGATTMSEALAEEWAAYQCVLPTRDRREALEAFAEKRAPRFEGR